MGLRGLQTPPSQGLWIFWGGIGFSFSWQTERLIVIPSEKTRHCLELLEGYSWKAKESPIFEAIVAGFRGEAA